MSHIIPDEIVQRKRTWHRAALGWKWAGIGIAIIGVASGLSVTAYAKSPTFANWIPLGGFISALSTALIALLKPLREGARYREAWRILDSACLEYSLGLEADTSLLIKAVKQGEATIGHIESSSSTAKETGTGKR
jgi:hypothetical protein